jgi:hypothetical protein
MGRSHIMIVQARKEGGNLFYTLDIRIFAVQKYSKLWKYGKRLMVTTYTK